MSPSFIGANQKVVYPAFMPGKQKQARPDGGDEASISWEDNENVLPQLFRERAISEHGAARVPTGAAEGTAQLAYCDGGFRLERFVLDGNESHGNLVYLASLDNTVRRMVAGALALNSTFIPRPQK